MLPYIIGSATHGTPRPIILTFFCIGFWRGRFEGTNGGHCPVPAGFCGEERCWKDAPSHTLISDHSESRFFFFLYHLSLFITVCSAIPLLSFYFAVCRASRYTTLTKASVKKKREREEKERERERERERGREISAFPPQLYAALFYL